MRKTPYILLGCLLVVVSLSVLMFLLRSGDKTVDRNGPPDTLPPSVSYTSEVSQQEADALVKFENERNAEFRSITLATPAEKQWWHDAVVYQIWPRSFKDSDGDGNGDLPGIIGKLDYLQSLGVGAIWLNPVFESNSYHGYDTTDYYQIESDFGTLEDFEKLTSEAHERGIKVVLDLVINHVSMDHPWFIKAANRDPAYEDYFVWSETMPAGYGRAWSDKSDPSAVWHYVGEEKYWRTESTRDDYFYGVFGFSQPDLNLANPKVQKEIENIASFWLEKGADGFRLDAVRYFIEEGGIPLQADTTSTLTYLKSFRNHVKAIKPDALLIGEAFADTPVAAKYYDEGNGLDAGFDFGFNLLVTDAVRPYLSDLKSEGSEQRYASVRDSLWDNLARKASTSAPIYFFANALSNHDLNRITLEFNNDPLRSKLAASLLFTFPGTSYIYYGEEIALPQFGPNDDIYRRAPMHWSGSKNAGFTEGEVAWVDQDKWLNWQSASDAWWRPFVDTRSSATFNADVESQLKDESSLLNYYKQLIRIRNQTPALRLPEEMNLYNDTGTAWVVEYKRHQRSVWVVLNLNPNGSETLSLPKSLNGRFRDLISKAELDAPKDIVLAAGELKILVPK